MNSMPPLSALDPEPLPRTTRADRLREALADDIISGKLDPGTRLDEHELARTFGVSRTPVREALRQLDATGLVETRPHRGVFVASLNPERLARLFEALAEVEGLCAGYAAIRMQPGQRRLLLEAHEACRQAMHETSTDIYHEANILFHDQVQRGSDNDFLHDSAVRLRQRLAPFSRAQFRTAGRLKRSFDEHDAVVTAIMRGDALMAQKTMRRHVGRVETAFADFAGEGPSSPLRLVSEDGTPLEGAG
jgi:DNA-binding GntR family transcriptional regulator